MQNRFFKDSIGGSIISSNLYADTYHFHSLDQLLIYTYIIREVLPMRSDRLYTFLKTNLGFVIPAILAILIIILAVSVYI